ncbi:hypothetical protein ENSA7_28710 [Enhygromyxa salina]|uniref:Uncharacterized protein n=1 Tax=Enhygromyxa salina TaxID=215803 RepID=A0A2S9YQN5_9BACT|nr:hypothetical protein ENSA7_28710 [Enhygromyxa salina]
MPTAARDPLQPTNHKVLRPQLIRRLGLARPLVPTGQLRNSGRARARALLQEQLGILALAPSHRVDHRLDLDELIVVSGLLEHLVRNVAAKQLTHRHLGHQVLHRAHRLDGLDLGQEVVHPEPAAEHLLGVGGGLLLVDDLLEVLHEADQVAHAQDSAGEALGSEFLELVEVLAHAQELDRLAGRGLDRQRRAAAGVTVELGQDHAGQVEALVERLGGGHRVLADHRVDDQEDVGRVHARLDVLELGHERVVDRQATGGVIDDEVDALGGGGLGGVAADVDRVGPGARKHGHAKPLAQHLQLVDRGGAVDVGRDQHDRVTVLLQLARELAGRGGLTRALQPDHHDPGDALARAGERGVDRAHQLDERVVADLDEVILGADPDLLVVLALRNQLDLLTERSLFDGAQELLDRAKFDVSLEQAQANVLQRSVDDFFAELALASQSLAGCPKTLGDGLEHEGLDSIEAGQLRQRRLWPPGASARLFR